MSRITYEGRIFCTVSNTENGEVDSQTSFYYHQQGEVVWATYTGGEILFGTLLAKSDEQGILDMRYQHLNRSGEFKTGKCRWVPFLLPDGRLMLKETWQWTCGDLSQGESVVEEIFGD